MFAEECIVGPSNRPRQIQLDGVPVIRRNQTPIRVKSRAQRRVASFNTPIKADSQLSIITLSSIHRPQPASNKHKCGQEILADLRGRQARYEAYRSVPVEHQGLLRRTATSHSCVLPSVDPDQTDPSVYHGSEEAEKSPKEPAEWMDLKETETNGTEVSAVLPHLSVIPEALSEQVLPPSLCRSESPDFKYLQSKADVSVYHLQTAVGLRKRPDSALRGGKQPPNSTNSSSLLPEFARNREKCQGQFCDYKQISNRNDPTRRYPVKRRLLQLAKLKEYSPTRRTELLIPSPESFLGLATEYSQALSLGGKASQAKKVSQDKLKSPLIEPRSRGFLKSSHHLPADEVAVCFRCFVVYENLRKLLND